MEEDLEDAESEGESDAEVEGEGSGGGGGRREGGREGGYQTGKGSEDLSSLKSWHNLRSSNLSEGEHDPLVEAPRSNFRRQCDRYWKVIKKRAPYYIPIIGWLPKYPFRDFFRSFLSSPSPSLIKSRSLVDDGLVD